MSARAVVSAIAFATVLVAGLPQNAAARVPTEGSFVPSSVHRAVSTMKASPNAVLFAVNGIVLVNRSHRLPSSYVPDSASARYGLAPEVNAALDAMFVDAARKGVTLRVRSGYRSYAEQKAIYEAKLAQYGYATASIYYAQPGASEHQTGLAADLTDAYGTRGSAFRTTPQARYLAANAYRFGFIIRYPDGKTSITGYAWEPWHVRYVGVPAATAITQRGVTLEEYLGQA